MALTRVVSAIGQRVEASWCMLILLSLPMLQLIYGTAVSIALHEDLMHGDSVSRQHRSRAVVARNSGFYSIIYGCK